MRHPQYTDWAITFLGLAFIFDSFLAIILAPFLILLLYLQAFLEEKLILFTKFGNPRLNFYKKKTPSKLFPSPYNLLLIIIYAIVIYIGFIILFLLDNIFKINNSLCKS
jgi:hypothetical protein